MRKCMNHFVLSFSIFTLLALFLPLASQAQTGDETLDRHLTDLQGTPPKSLSEKVLQETIIQMVQNMPAPPATPGQARRFLIRGETALEMIPGKERFRRAAVEFREAARTAPWLAETHFKLGQAEENAGDLGAAISSYQLYLRAAPGAPDAMDIEAKIFKLEYQLEIGASAPATPAKAASPPPAPKISGVELLFYIRPASTPEPKNIKSLASDFRYLVKYKFTGKALVEFDIDEKGKTSNFRIIKTSRQDIYDGIIQKLVRKFRFPANAPQMGVLYDLTLCLKSDQISPILCNIHFEKINDGTGDSPALVAYVIPFYNQNAANKGICGNVVMRFDVDRSGVVKNQEVVSASRSGQFEINIKSALASFKFARGKPAKGIEYKISFGLPGRCEAP